MAKKATKKKSSTKKATKKKVSTKKPVSKEKKATKRLAKPKVIMKPPMPGTPEMVIPPQPNHGGAVAASEYIPPGPNARGTHYPRYAAGIYYTTDVRGMTMEQMHRHPMWNKFNINTLHQWSREDQWVARRKANLQKWQTAIEHRIGNEMVKARMEDLKDLREIYQKAIRKLKSKALKARSYEGMVSALVKLAELMDTWSEKLSREFVPEMPMGADATMGGVHAHEVKPTISPTEARVAAKAVLSERRQQQRLKVAQEKAAVEGEERPQLVVVDGER